MREVTEAGRIVALLASEETVARDRVRSWMASDDLETLAATYALLDEAGRRIEPELSPEETTDMMRRYLLRCIEVNPPAGEYVHGGFEAAWALAACLKHWRVRAEPAVRPTADALRSLYMRTDQTTRNRILCGVLEHALEDPALRPYFATTWQRSRELREAHQLALEWGTAHEDD